MTATRLLPCLALLGALAAGCASVPPAATPAAPTFEQKMAAILRLEDHRVLREAVAAAPAAPPVSAPRAKGAPPVPPPPPPDLLSMLTDGEARIRRRAALAVGRVGLREGIAPLTALLADADPEVRQMAAFALGLIGDRAAAGALIAALNDSASIVQASAVEALGLIGDPAAAQPIGQAVTRALQAGAVAQPPGDQADVQRNTPAAVVRLGVTALARLKAYDALAAAVLDGGGQPRARWWPVASALGDIEDPRAEPALMALAKDPSVYTRAFAVKGLGALKDRKALPVLLPLVGSPDKAVAIEAIRALGRIGDAAAAGPLLQLAAVSNKDLNARLEALLALGSLHTNLGEAAPNAADALLDAMSDSSGAIRAAALRALATLDAQNFVLVLSGLDPDPDWRVRAALAGALGTLPADVARPRLRAMLDDRDQRVIPSVIRSLVAMKAPDAGTVALERLKADDPVVRAAAAEAIGATKPDGAAAALTAAYDAGQRDPTFGARAAVLAALTKLDAATAMPVLRRALADKDWAVRVRAAALVHELDPSADVSAEIRPAPSQFPPELYALPRIVNPPVSTSIYIDTDHGTMQLEMAVLDAPLTVENFVALARRGFFDGLTIHRVVPDFVVQDGDPRGDGEGGPGYTIRDELNERPFVRGAVGMALDWRDTGGSQFFVTLSPQPRLDAKYTVFGRVVSGMDVVDAIRQGDVIRRVRVWDGT